VIHSLHHEQDMRKMGGLWNQIPFVYTMMWIGNLALAGIPIFAGYYSKDAILEAAWMFNGLSGKHAYILGVCAAGLTSFYSWRLLFITFHGKKQFLSKITPCSWIMKIPLLLLSLGAIFSGVLGHDIFLGESNNFWKNSIILNHHLHPPKIIIFLPLVIGTIGIFISFLFYNQKRCLPDKLASLFPKIYLLFYNKWYFDRIYTRLFVWTSVKLGSFLWEKGDLGTIDRFGPNGISNLILKFSNRISKFQSGYIYHYSLAMVFGIMIFCLIIMLYLKEL
jgi:NADH-quinone oxidoreductase subunit L